MSGHLKSQRLTGVRQEVKYLLSPSIAPRVKEAVASQIDPKIVRGSDQSWRVSVYLDSPDYRLTKLGLINGSQTTKLRVKRYYLLNNSQPVYDDTCWIEVKTRAGSMVEKSRFSIPYQDVLPTLENGVGESETISATDDAAVKDFEALRQGQALSPLFVAHYRRYTFQDKESKIRVTMDDHVSFHAPPVGVFTEAVPICARAYLPPPLKVENYWIMEVKSLGLVPSWIDEVLEGAAPRDYSKFVTGLNAVVDNGLLKVG